MTAYSTNTQTNNTGATIAPISAYTPATTADNPHAPHPTAYTLISHKGNYHRILPTYTQAKRIAEILGYCGLDACIIPIVGGVA